MDSLEVESPGVRTLREAGVKIVLPLVTQGELIGLLNLGPRLSERGYSGDDRKLLENLSAQAAAAVRDLRGFPEPVRLHQLVERAPAVACSEPWPSVALVAP